ncbi:MAG: cell division protein FtsZ [bacterium]|nr:cell division protein FtsZ [bacterium]
MGGMPQAMEDIKPRITVIGVGGAGGNAVNNMIRSQLEGVEFVVCNTDAQAMSLALTKRRVNLGMEVTQGLGAGSRPDVGRASAEESIEEVISQVKGTNMLFITAGMGGGTGTGAAPVIARAARERGLLTVGVVTKPFHFEGIHRMRAAEAGIEEMQKYVDTLIVIPNQNLFRVANEKTTFSDAFRMADDVLYAGVRGVTDLMIMPGLINLDFADVRSVMSEMGKAMMGTGEAEGEGRAIAAAEAAISNPLLDDVSMKGARGILISITGGADLTLYEVDEAANRVRDEVDPEANIIFGSTFDDSLEGRMRVSVVATGIEAPLGERSNLKGQESGAAVQVQSLETQEDVSLSLEGEGTFDVQAQTNDSSDVMFAEDFDGANSEFQIEKSKTIQTELNLEAPSTQGNFGSASSFPVTEGASPAQKKSGGFFSKLFGRSRKASQEHTTPAHEPSFQPKEPASTFPQDAPLGGIPSKSEEGIPSVKSVSEDSLWPEEKGVAPLDDSFQENWGEPTTSSAPAPSSSFQENDGLEDDLEIPTFLRRRK